jgi:hypothetical protein
MFAKSVAFGETRRESVTKLARAEEQGRSFGGQVIVCDAETDAECASSHDQHLDDVDDALGLEVKESATASNQVADGRGL